MNYLAKIQEILSQWSLMARLTLFVSIFFIFIWLLVANHTWRKDLQQTEIFFDTQAVLLAKTIATLHIDTLITDRERLNDHWSAAMQESYDFANKDDIFSFTIFSEKGRRIFYNTKVGQDFPFTSRDGFVTKEIQNKKWCIFYYSVHHGKNRIAVGYELTSRQAMFFEMLVSHLTPWVIFLLCFLIGFRFLLKHELKALHSVVKNLQSRKVQETKPLEVSGLTAEIRPLVESLNSLFNRTAQLIEREHAFVANAAHELKTPLSGLRLQVEVLEKKIDDKVARNKALDKILQVSERCTRLVDQLLLLSSLESKNMIAQNEQKDIVPWNALLESAEQDILDAAIAKGVTLKFNAVKPNIVSYGVAELWTIVLRNMLDNAVRYTTKNGLVHVLLQEDILSVENSAEHLSEEVLKSLGQRFYRPAGQQEVGSGLGLAIMQHIAKLHNTSILIENIELQEHANTKIQGIKVSVKLK